MTTLCFLYNQSNWDFQFYNYLLIVLDYSFLPVIMLAMKNWKPFAECSRKGKRLFCIKVLKLESQPWRQQNKNKNKNKIIQTEILDLVVPFRKVAYNDWNDKLNSCWHTVSFTILKKKKKYTFVVFKNRTDRICSKSQREDEERGKVKGY